MLMAVRFVLVHSPAVGPATWRWVAGALQTAGHATSAPNLVAAAVTGDPAVLVEQVVAVCHDDNENDDDDIVIVGHSGAGAVLPVIAARLPRVRVTVFVDAGVPPCAGAFRVNGDFLAKLRELASDGILPVWSRWWADGVLEALVPSDERRHAVEAELPRVPLSFYEAAIEMPPGWCSGPIAYVLLSDSYRDDAGTASSRGWPVVERLGRHLDIVNDGDAIASILLQLADRT